MLSKLDLYWHLAKYQHANNLTLDNINIDSNVGNKELGNQPHGEPNGHKGT